MIFTLISEFSRIISGNMILQQSIQFQQHTIFAFYATVLLRVVPIRLYFSVFQMKFKFGVEQKNTGCFQKI